MHIFNDQSNQELKEEQERILELLRGQPQAEWLQTNLITISSRLGSFDRALERCLLLFKSDIENKDYTNLYILMLENAALHGQHDLIERHREAFEEMFDEPIISCEKLYNTFQELLPTEDHHLSAKGPQ